MMTRCGRQVLIVTSATISIANYRLVGRWPKQTTEAIIALLSDVLLRVQANQHK
jgi:hypothetical protein